MKQTSWFSGRVFFPLMMLIAAGLIYTLRDGSSSRAAERIAPDQRQAQADFSFKDLNGKTWTLSEHKGKVVFVNFFATWCPPCRAEMPGIVKLSDKYKDKGVEMVALSLDRDGEQKVKDFAAKYKIPFPVLMPPGNDPLLADITAIPVTLLIDKQGRVAQKIIGSVSEEVFDKSLEALANEKE